jgi:hypothetical protein
MPSAADLLSRSAGLLPAGDRERLGALAASLDAFLAIGRHDRVHSIARSSLAEARAAEDTCTTARFEMWVALMSAGDHGDPLADRLERAAQQLEDCDDRVGRAQVAEARSQLLWDEGDVDASTALMEEALVHARAGRNRPTLSRIVVWLLDRALEGPLPVLDAVDACARLDWVEGWSALVEVRRKIVRAALDAARGRPDDAGAALDEATALQSLLGQPGWVARAPQLGAWIDLLRGDAPGAIERLQGVFDELAAQGHPVAIESGVLLARALVRGDRSDEAVAVTERCQRILSKTPPEDAATGAEVAAIRACALVHRELKPAGDLESIAAELPPARLPIRRGDALLDLADAAARLGYIDHARRFAEEAIALYEAKGAVACTSRARKALARFGRQV